MTHSGPSSVAGECLQFGVSTAAISVERTSLAWEADVLPLNDTRHSVVSNSLLRRSVDTNTDDGRGTVALMAWASPRDVMVLGRVVDRDPIYEWRTTAAAGAPHPPA